MNTFKKYVTISLIMSFCWIGMSSTANAKRQKSNTGTPVTVNTADSVITVDLVNTEPSTVMVKKIVLFAEEVTQEGRDQYAGLWEPYGVSLISDLPFINGLLLSVPVSITSDDLADDASVVSVEDCNQKVTLQAVTASADGGAADGGAADGGASNFITGFDTIPNGDIPWATLHLLDQFYDPDYFTYEYNPGLLDSVVAEAINSGNLVELRVAIFDSGVDTSHRKLRRRIAGGIDLVNMTEGIPDDDNGHGTHVAGTLCGDNIGIVPYEPIPLYVVKVLDHNAVGDVSTLVMGFQWAIDNEIDIINMSVSYRQDHPAVRLAVQKAHEAGIVIIAAVGNHSNWDIPAPSASADGGAADGGAADGGAADGGAADGGAADGGAADGGAADGGAADGGAADGGAADGGAADGGAADGGAADGGAADGGAADGGAADGGAADGGAADGGAADGGAADGGAADGGAVDGGAVDGGAADGGAVDGGAVDGGAVDGGAVDGGAVDGGAADNGTETDIPWHGVMYPARYPEVIAVAAIDPDGYFANFNNDGPEVDLLAPGVDVVSTNMGGGYGVCSGSSMATPYVSGAVALMKALDMTLTPSEIRNIFMDTATDGVINLTAALHEVKARMNN